MDTQPVLRHAWSAETLLSAVQQLDCDGMDLPDDPEELKKLAEACVL